MSWGFKAGTVDRMILVETVGKRNNISGQKTAEEYIMELWQSAAAIRGIEAYMSEDI